MGERSGLVKRLTGLGASLGCVGCLGLLAAGAVLALVVIVVVGQVIQSQWERGLRWALDAPTGGEVNFEDLRLGLGKVTLTGLVVRSPSGHEVLRADALVARGSPWSLSSEHLALDGVDLAGVTVHLHRDGPAWELPTTTLSLLKGEALEAVSLPGLTVPELVLTDVTAVVSGPEGRASAHLDRVVVPDVSASMDPALVVEVGPLEVEGLSLSAPEAETLSVARVSLETDALSFSLAELPARGVHLEEIRAEIPPSGWGLPAAALGALEGGKGIAWPRLTATGVVLGDLELTSAGSGGSVALTLTEATVPSLGVSLGEHLDLELETVAVKGFALSSGGQSVARAPWAAVTVAPWSSDQAVLTVPSVSTGGAWAAVHKGRADLGIPAATWSLLGLAGMDCDGALVGSLAVDGAEARITAADGTLELAVVDLVVGDLSLAHGGSPAWSVGDLQATTTTVSEGGRTVATVSSATLSRRGTVTASGVHLWTTATSAHTLTLPPVVEDHAPTWLGGVRTDNRDAWYGVDFAGLPWQPDRLVATDVTVHLRDEALASPPRDWTLGVSRLSVGPRAGDEVPIRASVTMAGGEIDLDGHLSSGGTVGLELEGRKLEMQEFQSYVAAALRTYGLRVTEGVVAFEVLATVVRSTLTLDGDAHVRRLELRGTHRAGGVLAGAANRMPDITAPVSVRGDLSDPEFSPVRAAIQGAVDGVIHSVKGLGNTGAARSARDTANTTRDKARDKANDARDALNDVGSSLGIGGQNRKNKR